MALAIKVENLSKAYQLGEIGTGTLSRDLERWFAKIRGKEDPFLKIGQTNDRTTKSTSDVVWSLKDINFDIQEGDAVGIIGRNGAGKSTLLKLLSRVTSPTTGNIKIKGRIASLLEVGTGFHPELTGKENIYLNGAILGMRKKEIRRKFDEIVDFAGVERYIDTPVKRYSSGMYVRLAFAVAAHLESEILIVDEVLAVGDAEFQKKCLGKMGEVSKGEGRTVLFVSHNMASITNLCEKSILLNQGFVKDFGTTPSIIDKYINSGVLKDAEIIGSNIKVTKYSTTADFHSFRLYSQKKGITTDFGINEEIYVEMEYEVLISNSLVHPSIHLLDSFGTVIFATFSGPSASLVQDEYFGKPLRIGRYKATCTIPSFFLNEKNYSINGFLVPKALEDIGIVENALSFSVTETGEMRKEYTGDWIGLIRPKLHWRTTKINL